MVVTRTGGEDMGRCRAKGTELELGRLSKSRDLVYSTTTVLCTGNLLKSRFQVLSSHQKENERGVNCRRR